MGVEIELASLARRFYWALEPDAALLRADSRKLRNREIPLPRLNSERSRKCAPVLKFSLRLSEALCYDTAVAFKGFSSGSSVVKRYQPDFRSERNLAVAILKQAWHEAAIDLGLVKETSRKDYGQLKKKAIEWIRSDDDGFPYWCQLADVDHTAIRQRLNDTLRFQRRGPRVLVEAS